MWARKQAPAVYSYTVLIVLNMSVSVFFCYNVNGDKTV